MSAVLDKQIKDAVLRYAVDVMRVEAGVRTQVTRRLVLMQKELLALIATQGAPKTKKEMDQLLALANKIIARHYAIIDEKIVRPTLRTIAKTQAQHLAKSIETAKIPNA